MREKLKLNFIFSIYWQFYFKTKHLFVQNFNFQSFIVKIYIKLKVSNKKNLNEAFTLPTKNISCLITKCVLSSVL